MDLFRLRVVVVRGLMAIVLGGGLAAASLLDPSPLLVLRGSDQVSLADAMPETSSSISSMEGSKLVPLANYHSGERNASFYLFGDDQARFRLEYVASQPRSNVVQVAFLLDHRFIRPRFENVDGLAERDGVFHLPVVDGRVTSLAFAVDVPRGETCELHVVVSSHVTGRPPPGAVGPDQAVPLGDAYLHHANLVRGRYRLPAVESWRAPEVRKSTDARKRAELVVLRRGRSVAIVNNRSTSQRMVIAQPGAAPIYAQVEGRELQTHRDILTGVASPVVVVDSPYTRTETRFGFPAGSPLQAFLASGPGEPKAAR